MASPLAVPAEGSLPFRAGERRRRRLRELAGGPVGVTAAAAEGASPVVADVAEGRRLVLVQARHADADGPEIA